MPDTHRNYFCTVPLNINTVTFIKIETAKIESRTRLSAYTIIFSEKAIFSEVILYFFFILTAIEVSIAYV